MKSIFIKYDKDIYFWRMDFLSAYADFHEWHVKAAALKLSS